MCANGWVGQAQYEFCISAPPRFQLSCIFFFNARPARIPLKNSKSTRSVPQLVFLTKVRLWCAGQDWEALPPFSVNYGIIKTCLCSFASLFAQGRIRTCVGRRPPGLQPGTIDHSVTCASAIRAYYTPNFRKTKL